MARWKRSVSALSLTPDIQNIPDGFLDCEAEASRPRKARRVDSGYETSSIEEEEQDAFIASPVLLIPQTPQKTRRKVYEDEESIIGSDRDEHVPTWGKILAQRTPTKARSADSGFFDINRTPKPTIEDYHTGRGSLKADVTTAARNPFASTTSTNSTPRPSKLPPYLFRTTSERSRGRNTMSEMDPLFGYRAQYHETIDRFHEEEPKVLQNMIENHIAWKYGVPSEFTSWSASIMYVLIHAIRRMYNDGNKTIFVYVMDTSRLDEDCAHLASDLIERHEITFPGMQYYDPAEYLVHGKLDNRDGKWKAVNLNLLINAGLCRRIYKADKDGLCLDEMSYVCPTINNPALLGRLALRVEQLRKGYFAEKLDMSVRLDNHVAVAACFGTKWQGVVLIALLSMRSRRLDAAGLDIMMAMIKPSSKLPAVCSVVVDELYEGFTGIRDCVETVQFITMLRLAVSYRSMFSAG